jgi:hypothetical protein
MHIIYLKQDIYKKINSKWSWSQGYDDFYDKIDNAMIYIYIYIYEGTLMDIYTCGWFLLSLDEKWSN